MRILVNNIMKGAVYVVILFALLLGGACISYARQAWQEDVIIHLDGQAVRPEAPDLAAEESAGESCGIFEITGYCGCQECTRENHLTYAGTVPRAGHTVSADLDRFPLGTKLRIGDHEYTVEDTGASVEEDEIDIYFNTHEEASEWGRQQMEVFLAE